MPKKTLITHQALVELLGEVDAVCLESEESESAGFQDVVVYIELKSCRVELIRASRTGEGIISHCITRQGIRALLEEALL